MEMLSQDFDFIKTFGLHQEDLRSCKTRMSVKLWLSHFAHLIVVIFLSSLSVISFGYFWGIIFMRHVSLVIKEQRL